MDHLHPISRFGQALLHVLANHHGAVLAARAAERDRQIALAFTNIVRNQVISSSEMRLMNSCVCGNDLIVLGDLGMASR